MSSFPEQKQPSLTHYAADETFKALGPAVIYQMPPVVLEKFTDQLLEGDEHLKDNKLSSLAKLRNRCKVLANSKLMEI